MVNKHHLAKALTIMPRLYLSILLLLFPSTLLLADSTDVPPAQTPKYNIQIAPTHHIYSPYLADPKRVTFAFQTLHVSQSDIADSGMNRFALRMGGRLELFNWTGRDDPLQQLQANLEVGFRGHFDIERSQDNIGWDGNYGLIFTYRHNADIAFRFGPYHTSSHVGDEYAEGTGRKRIEYTREEILAGLLVNITSQWQYYLEAGYGYHQDEKPLQQRYRAQTGIQFQQAHLSTTERLGWYAGLDLSAYEERDWLINRALQVGFAFDAAPHVWRIALDYYRGQSVIGEFFQHNEEYVGFGLYLDI